MAHKTQIEWCKKVKKQYPEYFKKKRVLDVGSLDVNGNNKDLFEDCEYVGLDVVKGPNVDVVSIAHEFDDKPFDVVLSTNSFEHDMYYEQSIRRMFELLKPSGLMFFCCSSGHKTHGTKRKSPWASGTTQIGNEEWASYYRNLKIKDISKIFDFEKEFTEFTLEDKQMDVRFVGIKRG
jgi:predicted methyltransferase